MTFYSLRFIVFGVLLLTGLIFVSILRLRYITNKEKLLRRRAYCKMEALLLSLFDDQIPAYQWAVRIPAHELIYLEEFLLPYLESLKGESFNKLVAVAYHSGLVKRLLQEGRSPIAWRQAKAVYFLGLIREPQVLQLLKPGLTSGNMFWFYPSVIALARNNLRNLPQVLETLRIRSDWTEHLGVSIFAEMGEDVCPTLLATLAQGETSSKIERLALAVMAHFGYQGSASLLKETILYSKDRELRIRALRAWSQLKLGYFDGLAPTLQHPDWEIRVAAVTALGSSGTEDQAALAYPLLRDSDWWVRLRAAETMLKLSTREELYRILDDTLEDHYAQDMLRYVLTREGGATCAIPAFNPL